MCKTNHIYKSNLLWIIKVLSNRSPENLDVLKALVISAFCTHNDFNNKFHVFIRGEYASGKTHKAETVRVVLPENNRVMESVNGIMTDIQNVSPKYPFYSTQNGYKEDGEWIPIPTLYANRILYEDDVKASDIEPLKQMTNSNGCVPSWSVTNKDNTGTKTMILDGKPTIWISKVAGFDQDDGQLISRFYNIESVKEIEKVHAHIMHYEPDEIQLSAEEDVKKFIAERISTHCTFNISHEMKDKLPIPKDSNRNSTFELLALKAISKINAGSLDIAISPTEEDLFETIAMFKGKTSELQINGISAKAIMVLEYISEIEPSQGDMKDGSNPNGQTIEALLSTAGVGGVYPFSTLHRIILELEQSGHIAVLKGFNGKKYFYKVR